MNIDPVAAQVKRPMTIEKLEWWGGVLTTAAAWLGALAAIATIGALVFSNRASALKDEALEKFKAEATENTARLEKETASAKLELEKLKERHRPRELTQAHLNNPIWQTLKEFKNTRAQIVASPPTQESELLARGISVCLTSKGWTVEKLQGMPVPIFLSPSGIVIQYAVDPEYIKDRSKIDAEAVKPAAAIAAVLRACDLEAIAVPMERRPSGATVRIVIGPK